MFRVMKGPTKSKGVLDSTHGSISAANKRRDALKRSYRDGKDEIGRKVLVWVEEASDDDPPNYRRPRKGPWQQTKKAR